MTVAVHRSRSHRVSAVLLTFALCGLCRRSLSVYAYPIGFDLKSKET